MRTGSRRVNHLNHGERIDYDPEDEDLGKRIRGLQDG